MDSTITVEQINALKTQYLRDLNLSDPQALINSFYTIEGAQANELYQTALLTQEHLLSGVGALGSLLQDVLTNPLYEIENAEYVQTLVAMLPYLTGLIKGINHSISYLAYEVKIFELQNTSSSVIFNTENTQNNVEE